MARRAVTAAEMRGLDKEAITRYKIPVLLLMDHAGRCVASAARSLAAKTRIKKFIALCGGGNNGGDGVAAARYLQGWGFKTEIWWIKNPAQWEGDMAIHYEIARRVGVRFRPFLKMRNALPRLRKTGLLIDALLGTGTRGELREPYRTAIDAINRSGWPVVAVDIPSGLDADTGQSLGSTVRATVTVTMAAAKTGLLRSCARPYVGKLVIADIGMPFTV